MKKTFWAVFSWFKRKQAWLGLEEADSSHFLRYLCNEYHVSSQLITEQGLSNDSESMRLQWQDTPGRNWEEGKNFRWEHLLLLWGIRKPRSTFSSCLKPNPDPIWVPKDSIFHCQESWRKRRLSSFFLKSTKCAKCMAGKWSTGILIVAILYKNILPLYPFRSRIPTVSKDTTSPFLLQFPSTQRELPSFCYIVHGEGPLWVENKSEHRGYITFTQPGWPFSFHSQH